MSSMEPAPEGIDLSANHTVSSIAAVTILTVSGVGAVILRFVARRRMPGGLAIDDYLLLASLIICLGTLVCAILSLHYGAGHHVWALSEAELISILKITWADTEIYATCVALTKFSILFFYERLFGRGFATRFCMVLAILFWLANTIILLVGCRPISYFWDRYNSAASVQGHCISFDYFMWMGISDTIIDALVLLLPIHNVYKINISAKKKIGICGIFILGLFVCIAGALRGKILSLLSVSDFTWVTACSLMYTCVEPMVGIICACLPTYAIFFRPRVKRSQYHTGSSHTWTYPSDMESGKGGGSGGKASTYGTDTLVSSSGRGPFNGKGGTYEMETVAVASGGGEMGFSGATGTHSTDILIPSYPGGPEPEPEPELEPSCSPRVSNVMDLDSRAWYGQAS